MATSLELGADRHPGEAGDAGGQRGGGGVGGTAPLDLAGGDGLARGAVDDRHSGGERIGGAREGGAERELGRARRASGSGAIDEHIDLVEAG
jgi:hypothetical protein